MFYLKKTFLILILLGYSINECFSMDTVKQFLFNTVTSPEAKIFGMVTITACIHGMIFPHITSATFRAFNFKDFPTIKNIKFCLPRALLLSGAITLAARLSTKLPQLNLKDLVKPIACIAIATILLPLQQGSQARDYDRNILIKLIPENFINDVDKKFNDPLQRKKYYQWGVSAAAANSYFKPLLFGCPLYILLQRYLKN